MDTPVTEAAAGGTVFAGLAVLVVGIAIAVALIWSVRLGIRVRRREPAPPRPEEQPRLPDSGPAYETRRMREPNEMPRADDGPRLTPHELRPTGSRDSGDQSPRRWAPGSSGSFGSGGPGAR